MKTLRIVDTLKIDGCYECPFAVDDERGRTQCGHAMRVGESSTMSWDTGHKPRLVNLDGGLFDINCPLQEAP